MNKVKAGVKGSLPVVKKKSLVPATSASLSQQNDSSPVPQTTHRDFVGLYDFKKTLGTGTFGTVKLAEHALTKEQVAVKVLEKSNLDEMTKQRLYREVRVMQMVKHPNIISLYEVAETPTQLFLITEYADGGDLHDYICTRGKLSEDEARAFFQQILGAVAFCHELQVAHRDLKPENILMCGKTITKISDFGMSTQFRKGSMMNTVCGSLVYSAPELLLGEAYEGPAVDVYALGILLLFMVSGELPFDDRNPSETVVQIMEGRFRMGVYLSDDLQQLVRCMLYKDPKKRITIDQIRQSKWLKGLPVPKSSGQVKKQSIVSKQDEKDILRRMAEMGLDIEQFRRDLGGNIHSHAVATYHLLRMQKIRSRRGSAGDHLTLRTPQQGKYGTPHGGLSRDTPDGLPIMRSLSAEALGISPQNAAALAALDGSNLRAGVGDVGHPLLVPKSLGTLSAPLHVTQPAPQVYPSGRSRSVPNAALTSTGYRGTEGGRNRSSTTSTIKSGLGGAIKEDAGECPTPLGNHSTNVHIIAEEAEDDQDPDGSSTLVSLLPNWRSPTNAKPDCTNGADTYDGPGEADSRDGGNGVVRLEPRGKNTEREEVVGEQVDDTQEEGAPAGGVWWRACCCFI